MFRKIALTLAATAALGTAALAVSTGSADAKPFGYHKHHYHGHHHFHGHRFIAAPVVYAYGGGGCYVKRWVSTPWGLKLRWVNRCY